MDHHGVDSPFDLLPGVTGLPPPRSASAAGGNEVQASTTQQQQQQQEEEEQQQPAGQGHFTACKVDRCGNAAVFAYFGDAAATLCELHVPNRHPEETQVRTSGLRAE